MTNCPASVRIAVETDADALYAFCIGAHEEMRLASVNTERVWDTITSAVTKRVNPVFGLIKDERGTVVAAIGLQVSPFWYSDAPVLMSFFGGFVHPDHRKSTHAADLVAFSHWFGDKLKTPVLLIDWTDGESGKTRLFAKNGTRAGSMFLVGRAA